MAGSIIALLPSFGGIWLFFYHTTVPVIFIKSISNDDVYSSQVIQALDRMVSATCRRFCAIGSGRISRARVHADAPSSQHLAQQTKCKKRSEAGASACKRSGRATTEASALWEHIEHQAREAFVPEVPYFLQRHWNIVNSRIWSTKISYSGRS